MTAAGPRRELAVSWARKQLGWTDFSQESISSDASFRSYYRLRSGQDSRVVMDAPPKLENNTRAFADVAARLADSGVYVPKIFAHDAERGLMLLEDLGSQPYHHLLDDDNADQLYGNAVDALIRFQGRADISNLPDYDPALLMSELGLFTDWFLARHWQVDPTEDELDAWDLLCATLIRWALDQPQVFCHRDYMPRNLIRGKANPGIIDFQDAVRGPISYDPVCLFRDAFISWPTARTDAWLEDYRRRALSAGLPVAEDPQLWRRTCDFMGVQRHLKVIGIFARIRYRDGKPKYLEDAPRFFGYLEQAIARNPELGELGQLLTAWRRRAA